MNKKRVALFLALILSVAILSACSAGQQTDASAPVEATEVELLPETSAGEPERTEEFVLDEDEPLESQQENIAEDEIPSQGQTPESSAPPANSTASQAVSTLSSEPITNSENANQPTDHPSAQTADTGSEKDMSKIHITVEDKVFTATFHDNNSARTIAEQMPFTLNMNDYASQEKVARLSFDLPSTPTIQPSKIHTGDLYLWSGDSLVLFYTAFSNSYSGYVPIGSIDDATGLANALGNGSISVAFRLQE